MKGPRRDLKAVTGLRADFLCLSVLPNEDNLYDGLLNSPSGLEDTPNFCVRILMEASPSCLHIALHSFILYTINVQYSSIQSGRDCTTEN